VGVCESVKVWRQMKFMTRRRGEPKVWRSKTLASRLRVRVVLFPLAKKKLPRFIANHLNHARGTAKEVLTRGVSAFV
jgi:hypothetical protein